MQQSIIEIKRMFNLLVAMILDFLFIAIWVVLSWMVHHYLIIIFSPEGVQLYKFLVIESVVDTAMFFRLYKFLFPDTHKKPTHTPWWR